MLTILDIILLARVGLNAHFPWWLWTLAVINEFAVGTLQVDIRKAANVIIKKTLRGTP